jgi:putative ABC transport system permease protein
MNLIAYFFRLTRNNLRRGGQRVFVALLCIIFGVMSLTAMGMLAGSIEKTLILDPRQVLGGDLSLGRAQEEYLLPEHIEQLDALQTAGKVETYTTLAYTSNLMYHKPASGEVRFTGSGLGIDPNKYPIAGSLTIGEPGNVGISTLLQRSGDLIITRDIAREENFHVGDTLIIADQRSGAPVEGLIRGIAYDTPNHQGSKIYYSMQTAQLLAGNHPPANTALVNTNQIGPLVPELEKSGWNVSSAPAMAAGHSQSEDLILMCIKGAGILGLLVAGIGIANTMQVLLKRRQREVAIWKSLGYQETQLVVLFALEALLLGLVGSLAGAGLGVLVSSELVELFRRTSNLLFTWAFSPLPMLTSIMVGTLTTIVFAMWAIISASQAKPMALLRNEAVDVKHIPWLKAAALVVCLAVPLTALTTLVMGSLLGGIGVLLFALAGLIFLGGFFALIIWAATRFLPLRSLPLARLAQQSLRQRGLTLVFAMIALFAGILTMTFGIVVTEGSRREMSLRNIEVNGYNLNVIAPASQEARVRQEVEKLAPDQIGLGYTASVKAIRLAGEPVSMQPVLVGRSDPFDYQLKGAAWGSQPTGVYVYQAASEAKVGSKIEVEFWDGSRRAYPVVGTYDLDWSPGHLYPQSGLLLSADLYTQTVKPDSVTFFVRVPTSRLPKVTDDLGKSLPDATVVNLLAYATRYIQVYKNLFVLAVSMAALALLAGILLVANSVSLAMLDRRYEIGILKTLGYTRRHILVTLGVEYSMIALIASAAALLVVRGFLFVVGLNNPLAASVLQLSLPLAAIILICGAGLIWMTVLAVTWRPTQVSPGFVLNERGS